MIRVSDSPPLQGQARVDLQQNDFDSLIWTKGIEVLHEKVLRCPCKQSGGGALSSCLNCGGAGFLWINPTQTRMVVQSANRDTKFKDWSEENMGRISITAMSREKMTMMDRITILNGKSIITEVPYARKTAKNIFRARLIYPPIEVYDVFVFVGDKVPLLRLTAEQYQVTNTAVEITDNQINSKYADSLSLSIRYEHRPTYIVADLDRENIQQNEIDRNDERDEVKDFPLHAQGKRYHYYYDQIHANYLDGSQVWLFDNSYPESC